MRVVFFCSWHNGDVHLAKEYVRLFSDELLKQGVDTLFVTSRDPHIVNIKNLKAENTWVWPELSANPPTHWDIVNNTFYINIWVGHYGLTGGYSGNHTFSSQIPMWKMISEQLKKATGVEIEVPDIPLMYLPTIDDELLNNFDPVPPNSVMFCNSIPWSTQTYMGNMKQVIDTVSENYPSLNFVCTENVGLVKDNIFYTDDLTHRSEVDYNPLPEIAKMSESCKLIVTNCSGPGTFAMTRTNFLNPDKSVISFSGNERLLPWYGIDGLLARTSWSNSSSDSDALEMVDREIKEMYFKEIQ